MNIPAAITCVLLGSAASPSLVAQVPTARAPFPSNVESAGGFDRKEIPGDFLSVDIYRGTVRLQGIKTDRVSWQIGLALDTGRRGSIPPGWLGHWGNALGHGMALFGDHYQFVAGITEPDSSTIAHAEINLTVPRDLKLLHINLFGTGKVIVDGYDGELSVTADSGDIVGSNLGGAIQMEARNGGIDLDLSSAAPGRSQGPINLLSHNGSILILVGAAPSATLDLSTNCGRIVYNFIPTDGGPGPKPAVPRDRGSDAGCSLRPKSLPPLPGVKTLRYHANTRLGSGLITIEGMALQGDIIVSKKPEH